MAPTRVEASEAKKMAAARRHDLRVRGTFVPLSSLSSEQQTLLSAVPRWKRAWVRPSGLKEGQNPDYKVCKWVLDTAKAEEQGTAEEMEAAVSLVARGEASALPSTSNNNNNNNSKEDSMDVESTASASQRNTPAPVAQPTPAATSTVEAPNEIVTSTHAPPTTSPNAAVVGADVEPVDASPAKIDQEMEETRKEGDDFQEDEVELAKEATESMAVDA